MRNSLLLWTVLFAGMLCCSGCTHMGRINWTKRFERNPDLMERYPGFGALRLGTLYEVQRDMPLVRSSLRGYYRLTGFGSPGKPRSMEDFEGGQGDWWNFYGVVEKGTLIRAHRVASWIDRFGSGDGWSGIVYRIETGPHADKLLIPWPLVIDQSIDNPFGFVINQETMRLVKEGDLDAAGNPLPDDAPPAEYEGIGAVPQHLLEGRYLYTPFRGKRVIR